VLTDNDGGNAMLALSSAMPNYTDTSCIKVTYSGTVSATVRLYGTISGALAPYLTLKVTRGTDSAPAWDSCTNFTADATDYAGLGAGVLFDGNLSEFPTSFPTALADPASATAVETWTSTEAHSYKFQVTLQNNVAAQGLSGSAGFTWEAHNSVTGFPAQLDGTMGCISETGTSGTCVDGALLDEAVDVAVSPNGANVYAVTRNSDAVLAFSRDTTTGRLTQLSGTNGCISEAGSGGACVDGKALDRPHSVEVSSDGKHVYVASWDSDAVAVLIRNTGTGILSQAADTTGCVSETGTAGACTDGKGLVDPVTAAVSPDGTSVYAVTYGSSGVAAFSRNSTTGALTQLAGLTGCVTETGSGGTCTDGVALSQGIGVSVSPDGTSVYATSDGYDAVAVFSRDTGTGALTQLTSTSACVSETGSGGTCADGLALDGAYNVAFSPDSRHAYVGSYNSGGVAVFTRNKTTGALTQFTGTAACITETGTGGLCTDGKGLWGTRELAISPDGESLYVAGDTNDSVAVVARDGFSGRLSQSASTSVCLHETGAVGCLDGTGLDGATGVAVDPSGLNVYVASVNSDTIAVLRRQG
jgi:DNA-binding beta-propeller fold protein YncE